MKFDTVQKEVIKKFIDDGDLFLFENSGDGWILKGEKSRSFISFYTDAYYAVATEKNKSVATEFLINNRKITATFEEGRALELSSSDYEVISDIFADDSVLFVDGEVKK